MKDLSNLEIACFPRNLCK